MGFFSKKSKGTPAKLLQNFHGKRLSYVVERFGGEEEVIGKVGGISIDDEKLSIVCDGHITAQISTEGIVCAELMSHNGADIKGRDFISGKERHIVAHYSSFR